MISTKSCRVVEKVGVGLTDSDENKEAFSRENLNAPKWKMAPIYMPRMFVEQLALGRVRYRTCQFPLRRRSPKTSSCIAKSIQSR